MNITGDLCCYRPWPSGKPPRCLRCKADCEKCSARNYCFAREKWLRG